MLPALTARPRRIPTRRVMAMAGAVVFAAATLATQLTLSTPSAPAPSLADELRPASWALQVPTAWLAAPVPRLRKGDSLDILAVHGGDRAYTVPVAYAVVVLSADERGLVLEVDELDASAIAAARGGGLLLVPLLRSSR